MRVAIFSDSHDNIPNLNKFFDWINKNGIKEVIFCGDLCASATLRDIIMPKYEEKLYMVFGNVADRENLSKLVLKYNNVIHFGDQGSIKIDGLRIGFVHYPEKARIMAETKEYDFIFYGHTHKPWLESVGNCFMANPGTLAGLFNKATFAVLDTNTSKLELKLLDHF